MKDVQRSEWVRGRRGWIAGPAVCAALLLSACASAGPQAGGGGGEVAPAGGPSATRSVLAGVFTGSQATRGQTQFQQSCASCHSAGEFSGPVFQRIWTNRPVGELYHVISTMMPQNDPGSLSPQAYADIISYFLRQNGYPEGGQELPGDATVLDAVIFEPVS